MSGGWEIAATEASPRSIQLKHRPHLRTDERITPVPIYHKRHPRENLRLQAMQTDPVIS
jgi:hypothetical protein